MLSVRIVQIAALPLLKSSVTKVGCFSKFAHSPQLPIVRLFTENTKQSAWRTARHRRRTIAETITQPAGETGICNPCFINRYQAFLSLRFI